MIIFVDNIAKMLYYRYKAVYILRMELLGEVTLCLKGG